MLLGESLHSFSTKASTFCMAGIAMAVPTSSTAVLPREAKLFAAFENVTNIIRKGEPGEA